MDNFQKQRVYLFAERMVQRENYLTFESASEIFSLGGNLAVQTRQSEFMVLKHLMKMICSVQLCVRKLF